MLASGIDLEEFAGELQEELICLICHCGLAEPRSCTEGHSFCLACITEWLARHPHCPTDREPLTVATLTRNRTAQNLIAKLPARCPNWAADAEAASPERKRQRHEAASPDDSPAATPPDDPAHGCQWVGPHAEREAHAANGCGYQKVSCPVDGCSERVRRRDATEHQRQCPEARVACPVEGCVIKPKRKDLERHLEEDAQEHVSCLGQLFKTEREARRLAEQKVALQEQISRLSETMATEREGRTSAAASMRKVDVSWRIEDFQAKAAAKKDIYSKSVTLGPLPWCGSGVCHMRLSAGFIDQLMWHTVDGTATHLGLYIDHAGAIHRGERMPIRLKGSKVAVVRRDATVLRERSMDKDTDVNGAAGRGFGWPKFMPLEEASSALDSSGGLMVHASIRINAPPPNERVAL